MSVSSKLDELWLRLSTCKLTDFGSLLKGGHPTNSSDLSVREFSDACDKLGISTRKEGVTVEDVVWACILPHSKRQEHAMLTKFDLHVFEQRFGSSLEGSFCFAASFIMPPSSLNSLDLVVSTQLVHWFFPIAHLGEVESSNKRLLDKGKSAICYGRFSTLEELAANESCCVVLTFSTLSLNTRDILVGCCDHGFYVIHSDSVLQDVPSSDEMFSDYSRELGGLFEKLLLIGGLFKAVLARRFTDWPGGPCR